MKQAKGELEKLQREQDADSKGDRGEDEGARTRRTPTRPPAREAAEKLADAAKKQQELADKIEQLDAPGLENRKEKAADAAKQAAEDLQNGRTQDAPASQQQAKRQMEQLRQALDGQKPNDQKADELAKKQKEIADAAEKADGKAGASSSFSGCRTPSATLSKELGKVNDPAAAEQLNRTKEADPQGRGGDSKEGRRRVEEEDKGRGRATRPSRGPTGRDREGQRPGRAAWRSSKRLRPKRLRSRPGSRARREQNEAVEGGTSNANSTT